MCLTVVFGDTVNALPYRDCLVTIETVSHACCCHQEGVFAKHGITLRVADGRCFCSSVERFAPLFSGRSLEAYVTKKSFRINVAFPHSVCARHSREVIRRA